MKFNESKWSLWCHLNIEWIFWSVCWQVENNPWFYHHPDLYLKQVRIQTLLGQYTAAFAEHLTFRHWTLNDFSNYACRLIEILHEVIMYQMNVGKLFVVWINQALQGAPIIALVQLKNYKAKICFLFQKLLVSNYSIWWYFLWFGDQ